MENKVFLNRYRLSLGRNGLPVELHRTPNGITYRAHAIDSGREVAIELVPWSAPDESASAEMHATAAAARQINHINVPTLHDFGIEDDQLVYVTDYFDGHTAEAWVAARGPLTISSVLRIALQVTGALGAASFHRIHHTAINPANIIIVSGQTAEGDWPAIKVLHWLGPNVARTEGSDTRADTAARYASPEQLRGGRVDFASAIFSLGCTMWFLLTGVPPAVPGAKGVRAGLAKLRGLPKIVRHLLGRMLRVDPAERPHDPVVLQAYLQTCLARVERRESVSRRLGVPLMPRPRVTEARSVRNFPVKPLAIAALFLLGATLAVFALPRFFHSRRTAPASVRVENAPSVATPALLSSTAEPTLPNDSSMEPAAPAEGPDEIATNPPPPTPGQTVAVVVRRDAEAATPATEVAVATPTVEPSVAPIAQKEFPSLAAQSSAPPPKSAETPPAAVVQSSPSQIAETSSPPTPTPPLRKTPVEVAKNSSGKKSRNRSIAAARRSRSHSPRKTRLSHVEVRHGRKIPSLHVGSSRAELVGTTADGRWILSVASSGKRIIVPPPPEFVP